LKIAMPTKRPRRPLPEPGRGDCSAAAGEQRDADGQMDQREAAEESDQDGHHPVKRRQQLEMVEVLVHAVILHLHSPKREPAEERSTPGLRLDSFKGGHADASHADRRRCAPFRHDPAAFHDRRAPAIAIPPETAFLHHAQRLASGPAASLDALYALITEFPESAPGWADYGLEREAFRTALAALAPFSVADGVRCFYGSTPTSTAKRGGATRPRSHTPHLREIEALLPEARFVHILRDGRDVALSLRKTWFAPGKDMTAAGAVLDRGGHAGRRAGAGCRSLPRVRYEALVNDAERTSCAGSGLPGARFRPGDAALLRTHTGTSARSTAIASYVRGSYWSAIRNG
jgi:hypothetical protein